MFIHIGNNNAIRSRDIVSIIDYDVIKSSSILEEMIQNKKENKMVKGPRENAKSVIITDDKVYYSSLSVSTLKKRSSISSMIKKFDDYYEMGLEKIGRAHV